MTILIFINPHFLTRASAGNDVTGNRENGLFVRNSAVNNYNCYSSPPPPPLFSYQTQTQRFGHKGKGSPVSTR